ncbi:relaxase/mobilization nuclease domain-containing protein [Candidatus Pseudoscillospira sp. SGI.172]|uniref:relaxase/mobilization nuclease domain-containing protein n=1 Tax=Candidatus Pseudoscillospira sp. SGI.172 TaxID=3420582 RepID=UPI003D013FC1
MAIISFTNYKRGQTTGCMGAVMRYTMQDKKTEYDGQRLVTGINCQPESVYADFMTTKRLYHKTDGVLFYHMVQSFPKGEAVDPVTAHAAALKLAEYYEGYEVLVCTHTDREHIHSHFLINSVNFDTGKKLHIAKEQLQELRQCNDQVCAGFSLPVFQPREHKQKTKTMTIGEYHTAARGQSKKLQLMNVINDCMRHASNREEFITLMESEGYKVRWEDSRRNITYTTPSGWQCRDRLLFGDKYLKENMEHEFRIREEIINGRAHGAEPAYAHTAADSAGADTSSRSTSHERGVGGDDGGHLHTDSPYGETERVSEEGQRTAGTASHTDAGGRTAESGEASGTDGRTGWEAEREAFFSAQHQPAQSGVSTPVSGSTADPCGAVCLMDDVVQLGRSLERDQYAGPVMDSTTVRHHADSKTLRKEMEKKIAHGHKADDHEEEQIHTWQQTM